MALKAKVDTKTNVLTITIDMEEEFLPSGSGKTLVVASTHGNIRCEDVVVNGKPLTIGLNAYIKP